MTGHDRMCRLLSIIVLPLLVVCFSSVREVHQLPTHAAAAATASSTYANSTLQINVTSQFIRDRCDSTCGIGSVCQQDQYGMVQLCESCDSSHQLSPSGVCRSNAACAAWPWCSTSDALVVLRLHTILLSAQMSHIVTFNRTYVDSVDDSQQLATSAQWPNITLLVPSLTSHEAIQLITNFTQARSQVSMEPNAWFNDETGWWNTSLTVYRNVLPTPYVAYVTSIKHSVCTQTWTGDSLNTCTHSHSTNESI